MSTEYEIEGRKVRVPVEVRDACSISATFLVRADAVRRTLAVPSLEVAELLPGRALCTIAGVQYRDNDLGCYDEVGVVFLVRPAGTRSLPLLGTALDLVRGRLGAYIHQLPVTTSFSSAAGRHIWGFPKFLAAIRFADGPAGRCVVLEADGQHVLTLTVPCRVRSRTYPESTLVAWTSLGGVVRRIPFVSSGAGVGFRPGGATLVLGAHPIATELRGLGLPRRALGCARVEHMRMCFGAPEPG